MKKGMLTVIAAMLGGIAGAAISGKIAFNGMKQKAIKVDKYKGYYEMLNQWLNLKQQGKSLAQYFTDHNYKTIAIYGMGEMGNRLYEDLKHTELHILYAIDKEAMSSYSELKMFELEDKLPEVDAIIVTATFAYEEIEEKLNQKVEFPIISLDSVIFNC